MADPKSCLILVLVAILFISGCVGQPPAEAPDEPSKAPLFAPTICDQYKEELGLDYKMCKVLVEGDESACDKMSATAGTGQSESPKDKCHRLFSLKDEIVKRDVIKDMVEGNTIRDAEICDDLGDYCRTQLALQKKDASYCRGFYCENKLAVETNDVSLCEYDANNINDYTLPEKIKSASVTSKTNYKLKLAAEYGAICRSEIAFNNNDISYCDDGKESSTVKASCLAMIGIRKSDITYCENADYDYCGSMVASSTDECDKYKDEWFPHLNTCEERAEFIKEGENDPIKFCTEEEYSNRMIAYALGKIDSIDNLYCLKGHAKKYPGTYPCNELKGHYSEKDRCLVWAAIEAGSGDPSTCSRNSDCSLILSVQAGDISGCDNFDNDYAKKNCIVDYAAIKNDLDACKSLEYGALSNCLLEAIAENR